MKEKITEKNVKKSDKSGKKEAVKTPSIKKASSGEGDLEESPPKEKAAIETKEDIHMNMQLGKELEEAQEKFLTLTQ